MHFSSAAALLAAASSAQAVMQGFNYGANNADGSCRTYNDFHSMFSQMRTLKGNEGFKSARLYTAVQCGSSDDSPIEAIKAAIDTSTDLLLGVWASSGQEQIDKEISALTKAAKQWPQNMKQRVKSISVGSEDLYRASAEGQANSAGVGANADQIVSYINQIRGALKGTVLEGVQIGHVDTYTGWDLAENQKVIDTVDWLGYNGFSYFDTSTDNSVSQGGNMFMGGLTGIEAKAAGKPVWVTETGWPVRGPTRGQAVASAENAQIYWNEVGCKSLFGQRNTFWYTLHDANTAQTDMSFAVANPDGGLKFSLQCAA